MLQIQIFMYDFYTILLYRGVIGIKVFDIDYFIEKVVRMFFNINFSFPARFYTNMIVRMELLIYVPYNI